MGPATERFLSAWTDALASYDHLTWRIVAGPRGIYYFILPVILVSALLVPPSVLSTAQLRSLVLPLSTAVFVYYNLTQGGFDVISLDVFLWTFVLVGYYDPRNDFRKIHVISRHARAPESTDPLLQNGNGNNGPVSRPRPKRMSSLSNKDRPVLPGTPPKQVRFRSTSKHEQVPLNYWEEPYPNNFKARLFWTLDLIGTFRLSNWRIGHLDHDRMQPQPEHDRNVFIRMIFWGCVRGYFALDTAHFLASKDPYFHDFQVGILDVSSHPFLPAIAREGLPAFLLVILRICILEAAIYGSVAFYTFYLQTMVASLLALIFPFNYEWKPWHWPRHFGPFSSIPDNGIRGLWGQWWHQYMRQLAMPPGRMVANYFNLPPKSMLRYALISASSFFVSGVIHMGLVPPAPLWADMSAIQLRVLMASFFWVQFLGVMIEVIVSKISNRLFNPDFMDSGIRKALTFIWVAIWMGITFPIIGVVAKQLGYWRIHSVPVSFWYGMLEGEWVKWH